MKKITRHQMRENVFILSFEQIFQKESCDEVLALADACGEPIVTEQVEEMFRGIEAHLSEIDAEIEKHLKNWTMDRLSKVSLAILRLGVYEVFHCDDVDNDIVVSECVKLATTFAFEDDVAFVNGILGSIVRGIKE